MSLPFIHLHPDPAAKLYHQDPGCPTLSTPATDDQRISRDDAEAAGLTPCAACRPMVLVRVGTRRVAFHSDHACADLQSRETKCIGYEARPRAEAAAALKLKPCARCVPPVTYAVRGGRQEVTREQVEIAAARSIPAHGTTLGQPVWYALAGSGLHWVVTLLEDATGKRPATATTARLALAELGFPVMCWAWNRDFLERGHPWNTAT
ncbi:hypothetical protein ACIPW5_25455 [Streptomyces sp. NPDC090077]|uniref:hypothetical protein n=1 Tax=Streptomyces sp. NPDC090077 TaxID=3365938 RepID=UPI003820EF2D